MKNRISFLICPFLAMGLLLLLLNSCKKEEETKTKIDPVITWENPDDIAFVTLLSATQLNAIADVPGSFVYTPAIGTVLNVGASQKLKVDFTPTDSEKYNTATKTVTINISSFTTLTDFDGNTYHAIAIGTQTWMVENLKVTHYRNGEEILYLTDDIVWVASTSGAYCWHNNNPNNKSNFGSLYNWFAVSDSRNIAPIGWHVPTNDEWAILIDYLGGYELAGGLMKEAGTAHWLSPNSSATNVSGFTALPSGRRSYNDGTFSDLGVNGYWWSSTTKDTSSAWDRNLYYSNAWCESYFAGKQYGFSIRCILD
jgi:uncharacterized protein (TIGR02145 family)